MILPFGKHKGSDIEDVPHDYLEWLLENCDLRDSLRKAIEAVLYGEPQPQIVIGGFDIEAWKRKLAAEFHPDHGGSTEAMKAINRAYDLAKEMSRK